MPLEYDTNYFLKANTKKITFIYLIHFHFSSLSSHLNNYITRFWEY